MTNTKSFAAEFLAGNADFRAMVSKADLFQYLSEKLPQVTIDNQKYYIAEGDTLLDEDQLAIYAFQRQKQNEVNEANIKASEAGLGVLTLAEATPRGLLGMTHGGKIVRWKPDQILSYRVAKDTFTADAKYKLVVDCMEKATKDWENTCGVKFEYKSDLDEKPGPAPEGALFSVREINADGSFIAAAFFPNDPPSKRRVLIDPSFFGDQLSFDRIGVLRHELGHVLGFRHEHIRSGAPRECPDESPAGTFDLTKYDPQSVMHYFCGEVGSRDLKITDLDRVGAQRIYGPPLAGTEFVAA